MSCESLKFRMKMTYSLLCRYFKNILYICTHIYIYIHIYTHIRSLYIYVCVYIYAFRLSREVFLNQL